jgi:hypothetical protein
MVRDSTFMAQLAIERQSRRELLALLLPQQEWVQNPSPRENLFKDRRSRKKLLELYTRQTDVGASKNTAAKDLRVHSFSTTAGEQIKNQELHSNLSSLDWGNDAESDCPVVPDDFGGLPGRSKNIRAGLRNKHMSSRPRPTSAFLSGAQIRAGDIIYGEPCGQSALEPLRNPVAGAGGSGQPEVFQGSMAANLAQPFRLLPCKLSQCSLSPAAETRAGPLRMNVGMVGPSSEGLCLYGAHVQAWAHMRVKPVDVPGTNVTTKTTDRHNETPAIRLGMLNVAMPPSVLMDEETETQTRSTSSSGGQQSSVPTYAAHEVSTSCSTDERLHASAYRPHRASAPASVR